MKRNAGIDFMRGLVMIIMALDHVRDLLHTTSLTQSPTNLDTTTPTLFFTRWITHLCAPTFVFMSGTSCFLSMQKQQDIPAMRKFLFTRGLWLIVLEFTVVNFGLWFDLHFSFLIFEVIAAIGVGFIILSFLLRVSPRVLLLTGIAILILQNLIPFAPGANSSILVKLVASLFAPGVFPYGDDKLFFVGYPPIPWLAIMLIGFGAGQLFTLPENKQRTIFLKAGLVALGVFFLLRMINVYGDPSRWMVQKTLLFSMLSFLNVSKYPPSLLFCLLFLGIILLILSLVQGWKNKWVERVSVYGKTPLFYFLTHWYIIHPLLFVIIFLQGYKPSDMVFGSNFGRPKTASGIELWAVYLVWIAIVLIMYPLCKWYGRYKAKHPEKKWLRYI